MAEMNADSVQDQAIPSAQPITTGTPVQPSEAPAAEKMYPESHVGYVAQKERQRGYEKAQKEFSSQQAQQQPQQPSQSSTWNQTSIGGMPSGPSTADIQKLVDERLVQIQREQMGQYVANTFFQKLHSGAEKNPEMGNLLNQVNYDKIPEIVGWVSELPHTAEVMHELVKHNKLGQLQSMVNIAPGKVKEELLNISNSIATNAVAGQVRTPNEPLSQVRHSTVGTGVDNGKYGSVSDFRKRYKG